MAMENICYNRCAAATYKMQHGEDIESELKEAAAYTQQALSIEKNSPYSNCCIGEIYRIRFDNEIRKGNYYKDMFNNAIAYYAKATEANAKIFEAYTGMASLLLRDARYKFEKGKNPLETLRKAEVQAEKAMKINASSIVPYIQRGELALLEAKWQKKNGLGFKKSLKKAESAFSKAMQINPQDAELQDAMKQGGKGIGE
ncbi:MAG: hypothetical protein A2Y62_07635 [Candidatus Fischerbacteria bacterium RBG_13_37_8]|uniref:Uncharacterized protein n=1 Tax=Candidatus Fischerbacteria bacterium RBG_13_37_8 TaxID=1817863 RepID=A0A1F5VI89_9BACT|nr:MAG: hypothetical protein A2Y62_07635 [Candidatus Fischerbacteria bacterium RBG_13_37_8]